MTPSDPSAFTPETIRTAVVKRALRGFRREDVDRLLRELADHEQARREVLAEHEREVAQLRVRVAELARRREREQELASAYTVLLHAACDEAGVEVPSADRQARLLAR